MGCAGHRCDDACMNETSADVTTEGESSVHRPTVDEMSEWSFPASDPPATWTWEPKPQTVIPADAASGPDRSA